MGTALPRLMVFYRGNIPHDTHAVIAEIGNHQIFSNNMYPACFCLNPDDFLRIFYYILVILHTEPMCPISHHNWRFCDHVFGNPQFLGNGFRNDWLAIGRIGIQLFVVPVAGWTEYAFPFHKTPLFYCSGNESLSYIYAYFLYFMTFPFLCDKRCEQRQKARKEPRRRNSFRRCYLLLISWCLG